MDEPSGPSRRAFMLFWPSVRNGISLYVGEVFSSSAVKGRRSGPH